MKDLNFQRTARLKIAIVGLFCLGFFSACGSGGAGGGTPPIDAPDIQISGAALKGEVAEGSLVAYALVEGEIGPPIASTVTTVSGTYSFSFSDYIGAVYLEITGGTFIDEASGLTIALPTEGGSGLSAVIANVSPGQRIIAMISPLTTLSTRLAMRKPGGLTAENIASAHARIGQYFGGIHILETVPINPLIAGSASDADQSAIDYGLILAGISQLAQNQGLSTPMILLEALAKDISDDLPDGLEAGLPIALNTTKTLRPTALSSDLAAAIKTFSDDLSRNLSGGSISAALLTQLSNPTLSVVMNPEGTGGGTVTSNPGEINCESQCSESYLSGTSVRLTAVADPGSLFVEWGAACSGKEDCVLTMNADQEVRARFDLESPPPPPPPPPPVAHTLNIQKNGSGSGVVTSDIGTIHCGLLCSEDYPAGTLVTLSAIADADSTFGGWTGPCTINGKGDCIVTMDADKTVTAQFVIKVVSHRLTVSKDPSGSGSGKVTSNPGNINCGGTCSQDYVFGTPVTLTPTPDAGSVFVGWSNACSGNAGCLLTMNADKTVTAKFNTASPTPVFSVSGNVNYTGSKTGRIYIRLIPSSTTKVIHGTSIAAPGAYRIRGVPADAYTVEAYMDHRTPASGVRNVSNPIQSTTVLTVVSNNKTGVNITLKDPVGVPTAVPPSKAPEVYPFDGGALVLWTPVKNGSGIETTGAYEIYWATTPAVSPSEFDGMLTVPARDAGHVAIAALTNGETLYFIVRSMVGTTPSQPTLATPATIGFPAETGASVSGIVSFPEAVSGPLYVRLKKLSNNRRFISRIDNPSSPQAYSISSLSPGLYAFDAIIDSDGNGVLGNPGDLLGGMRNKILQIESADLNHDETLSSAGGFTEITTLNKDGAPCCTRVFRVGQGSKLPVSLTLSGPHIPIMDIYRSGGRDPVFDLALDPASLPAPLVGDAYQFDIVYADGTGESLSAEVSGVLNAFPIPLAPIAEVAGVTQPLFLWDPPSAATPTPFYFRLKLSRATGVSEIWNPNPIPSSDTSLLYNADGSAALSALISGQTYRWRIGVEDRLGNATLSSGTDFLP